MEINDRIRMIIESHKISAGVFADKIGVQRSNVSHILSGRNKPGFEFLEKVLIAFPKVQAHWLLTGKQLRFQEDAAKSISSVMKDEDPPVYQSKSAVRKPEAKKVVKVIQFYGDFTFDTYYPNAE